MAKLTPAQRKRLDKLATYLEGLPKGYRHFGMPLWMAGSDRISLAQYALHNGGVESCGTAACAAGHGPAAGILVPPRMVSPSGFVDWWSYSRLFVGGCAGQPFGWCFDGAWESPDNHHWGAAARIRYLLDKSSPPEDFDRPSRHWLKHYRPYRIDVARKASSAVVEGVGV